MARSSKARLGRKTGRASGGGQHADIHGDPSPQPGGGTSRRGRRPYRCLAPRPQSFVARGEYAAIRDHLIGAAAPRAGHSVGITTALNGAGGFGKTTIAQALCDDSQVQAAYPDGILWVTFGEKLTDGDRLARLLDLLRRWRDSDPPAFATVDSAGGYLRDALAGLQVLVVADDVWSPRDLAAFQGLDPTATLLVTTRDRRNLPMRCIADDVDAMAPKEAAALLSEGIEGLPPRRLEALAQRLGEWPLLLALVNRQIYERMRDGSQTAECALEEVEALLAERGLTAFDRNDVEGRNFAVDRTLIASVQLLSEDDRRRYMALAIFPEDADIPCSTLAGLWGLSQTRVVELCRRLFQLSLAVRFDASSQTLRLHDVVRAWLCRRPETVLAGQHQRFLDARRLPGGWPALPADEAYLWRHLAYHLVEAGRKAELRGLLLDYAWIEAKLAASDINTLLADFDAMHHASAVRPIEEALRHAALALAKHPEQLPGQLLGRLLGRRDPGIAALCAQVRPTWPGLWLRPRAGSMLQPRELLRTLSILPANVTALAALADGRLVSGSTDGLLRVWDLDRGEIVRTLRGHSQKVLAAVALPDGRIVSTASDRTLRVWIADRDEATQSFELESDRVGTLAALDDGHVVAGSSYGPLRIWDLATGESTVVPGCAGVLAMGLLSQVRIVCGSSGGHLLICNLEARRVEDTINVPAGRVVAIAVLPDGRVATGSEDGIVRVWDLARNEVALHLEGHLGTVDSLAVLPDGRLVSGSDDRSVRVWDLERGKTVAVLAGHWVWVRAIAAMPDGRFVSCSDGTLRIWRLGTDAGGVSERSRYWVTGVAALPDGRVVSCSGDGELRVWDPASGKAVRSLRKPGPSTTVRTVKSDAILGMAVLADGGVACGTHDHRLRVWDVDTRKFKTLSGHSAAVSDVEVLRDGRVLTAAADWTLRLWNVATGKSTVYRWDWLDAATRVAALPNGRILVAFEGGLLQVREIETGEVTVVLEGHTAGANSFATLPGNRLVSASQDRTLRLWDVDTGRAIRVFTGHLDTVLAVATLAETWLVSGSFDHTLRIWYLDTAETALVFTLDAPVTAVAVIGECDIVAGDAAGNVHFFRVEGLGDDGGQVRWRVASAPEDEDDGGAARR